MPDLNSFSGISDAFKSPTFTYSPTDIQIILVIGGTNPYTHKVVGFADGTFIQIDRDTPVFKTSQPSMDGRVQRSLGYSDGLYTISLTLAQTSASNSELENMYVKDVEDTYNFNSAVQAGLIIKDLKSTMIIDNWPVWVEALPSVAYSSTLEVRQWTLKTHGREQDIAVRGNDTEFQGRGIAGPAIEAGTGFLGKFRG